MYETLIKAIYFASVKHINQRRKNVTKDPYINHPIGVMSILSECGVTDIDTLSAAVLHDTIEDTDATYDEIVREFGHEIADLVAFVTDNKSLSKVTRKLQQIEHANDPMMPIKAKLVKLADKLDNLNKLNSDPPTSWTPEIVSGYFEWSYHVCEPMFGINTKLDNLLKDLFQKNGIVEKSDEKLQSYLYLLNNFKN